MFASHLRGRRLESGNPGCGLPVRGLRRAYNIAQQPRDVEASGTRAASAYGELQPHQRRTAPTVSCYVPPPPDYLTDIHDPHHNDLIKPRKLLNPVKSSQSHQELHRELMTSCKRGGGVRVESNKPELERVLECRRRDQLIKERKKQEEARRKISPLEAELRKRHQALEEMELEQQKDERDKLAAPEFVKVKENLRRTSYTGKEEKQV
ncbi:protein FAM107B-like isoform X2 [Hippocampus zosterae]|uniref:protein FAM107B-like isoform X2 n=1 Tax=Hippocampus zosterae TaxID=109293 RepID=UPI00223E01DD|nr:protein FAM107B-like isoform X2 [Hippocampus zosterae]